MIRRDGCESMLAEIMSIWPPIILTCICLLGNNGLLWSHATLFCSCLPGKRMKWEHKEKSEYSSVSAWSFFFVCFLQGRQWGLGIWSISCFAQQTDSHSQPSACLCLSDILYVCFCVTICFFLFLYNLILLHRRLKEFLTCIQMHKALHYNNISWTSEHYIRLVCTSLVINMGNTRFRWISDTWWGHCPLYLPFIPLPPFFYLSYTFPFCLSFFP